MRALIAGAAGFIGSNLTRRLLAEGWEVIAVDNLVTGRLSNLEACRSDPRFHFIEADLVHPLNIPGRLDWILHFASPASPPKYLDYPIETLRINSEGTYNLLTTASLKGAKFFFASTSEIYGDPLIHPQPESYWGHVNPVGPRSVYDEAKRFGEAMVYACRRSLAVPVRVIRIFNTYGPFMDPDDGRVVSNLICAALRGQPMTIYGKGQQTRSFQFVDDLVEGIIRLMAVEYEEPMNLGNPEEFSVLELARMVQETTGTRSEIVFRPLPQDDPKQRRPVIDRARGVLGWAPRIPLRLGLPATVKYFREELDLQEPRIEYQPGIESRAVGAPARG
ncbi:MAG TPA: UDP-glucuronic acid decarboxylase family protein [Bryobacteraceae bacterium]